MRNEWADEEAYWRSNYSDRPYAAGLDYESFGGAYRYGYDARTRYNNRDWNDVELDLERDWDSYEHRGESTWQQVKDAVRDAWDRVTGNRQTRTA